MAVQTRGPALGEVSAPMRELLVWVARCPRTYEDAMAAWRSSCPRFSVWEDALDAGFIRVERHVAGCETTIALTPRGSAVLGET